MPDNACCPYCSAPLNEAYLYVRGIGAALYRSSDPDVRFFSRSNLEQVRLELTSILAGEHLHTDTVVIRFPSTKAIDGWYASPAYQSLIPLRKKVAEIVLLAALSYHANLSVGCYCENEHRCHRSILRELLTERGAKLKPTSKIV